MSLFIVEFRMNLFAKTSKVLISHLNSNENIFVARVFYFIIQKMIYVKYEFYLTTVFFILENNSKGF